MLCPEVWNFEPSPHVVSSNFCESEEEIRRRIRFQCFNHHVSIMLPNTVKVPLHVVDQVLGDSQYYRINKVRAAEFFNQDFVDLFINKGQLTALSLHEFSEQDSLAILPCRKLILSLSQSSYRQLGILEDFPVHFNSDLPKCFVNLDLSSGTNESKMKCLEMERKLWRLNLRFDIVLAWEPVSPDICPSSIVHYFFKKGYFVKTCYITCQQKLKYNVAVPKCVHTSHVNDLMEWLGAFSLDCDMSNDNFISTFKCPEESEILGQVLYLSFTGLLTQSRLQKIISELNLHIKANSSDIWISMCAQAFKNSILSIRNKKLFFSEGDCQCTIIFRWNHPFIVNIFQDKKS